MDHKKSEPIFLSKKESFTDNNDYKPSKFLRSNVLSGKNVADEKRMSFKQKDTSENKDELITEIKSSLV